MITVLSLLWGCGGDPAPQPAVPDPPDVVLVVLDTVRADHLSTYGYERPTSPRLDALGAKSLVFDHAYTTAGWTAPAHASMFTGLYAANHQTTQEHWDLQESQDTLAERLQAAGYDTYGVVGNGMLSEARGFSQGFDTYEESWRKAGRKVLDGHSADRVEALLSERSSDDPYFLFVNLIGPHSPYDSCGEACGTFAPFKKTEPPSNKWSSFYLGRRTWTDEDYAWLSDLYDAEIIEADRQLGRILDAIDAHGRPDNTVIIVTSDHGENIGDHGHVDHVFSLHESVVHVPLVVSLPDTEAKRISERVQLTDLLPTVLDRVGLPHEGLQGVDLAGPIPDDRPMFLEYYRPVQAFQILEEMGKEDELEALSTVRNRRLRAVIEPGGDKLHWSSDGWRALYRLPVDPNETSDLHQGEADRVAALEGALGDLVSHYEGGGEVVQTGASEVDDETRKALEALGYLASPEDVEPATNEDDADREGDPVVEESEASEGG